jgi:hypothetical protein
MSSQSARLRTGILDSPYREYLQARIPLAKDVLLGSDINTPDLTAHTALRRLDALLQALNPACLIGNDVQQAEELNAVLQSSLPVYAQECCKLEQMLYLDDNVDESRLSPPAVAAASVCAQYCVRSSCASEGNPTGAFDLVAMYIVVGATRQEQANKGGLLMLDTDAVKDYSDNPLLTKVFSNTLHGL